MRAAESGKASEMMDPSTDRPRLVLFTCCLSLFMVAMDVTIVNVALPSIRADLSASTADLQWTVDAYTLVVASLLMLAGSMADRFGRRRVFQLGMATFGLGSMLCGMAPSIGWLVAFRIVQALGGAMLNPVAMAIITNIFTQPRERAKAIGIWGAVAGIAMAAGPPAGGFLTQWIGWRAIFWINLPIGAAAILLAALFIPESKAARPRRIDGFGQILVVSMLASLIAAVIEGPRLGWGSPGTLGLFTIAASAFAGLLAWEPRRQDPLIDLQLFRSVPFAGAAATAVCAFAAFGGFLFLTSLYLQEILGYSAFESGLSTLPVAIGTVLCSPVSGRMVGRWGARPSLACAGAAIALSGMLLTRLEAGTPLLYIVTVFFIFGVGFGMVNAPITYTAVSGLPRDRAGVAAGIASASRQTGTSLGVAVAGTVASAGASGRFGADLVANTHIIWWVLCGCGLFVLGLGLISTSRWGMATMRYAAGLFTEENVLPINKA